MQLRRRPATIEWRLQAKEVQAIKKLIFVVVVTLGMTAMVAMAGADTTKAFRGVFSGPVVYEGCATAPSTIATGTWSVVLHGRDEATVNVNIFTNGRLHGGQRHHACRARRDLTQEPSLDPLRPVNTCWSTRRWFSKLSRTHDLYSRVVTRLTVG